MLGVANRSGPSSGLWWAIARRRWPRAAARFALVQPDSPAPARKVVDTAAPGVVPDGASAPDPRAVLGALYAEHARAILAYLYHRLPELADAEDALGEVFVAALRACATGNAPDLSWLLLVARRRIADFYRERERAVSVSAPAELAAQVAADARAEPEQQALRGEDRRTLHLLIAALPPEQRDVLALRFAAGLRAPQIASLLGKSDEAIRALLSRAVRRLRKEWER